MSGEVKTELASSETASKPKSDTPNSQRGQRSVHGGSRGPAGALGGRGGGPSSHRGNMGHGPHGGRGGSRGGGRSGSFGNRDGSQHREGGRGMSHLISISQLNVHKF